MKKEQIVPKRRHIKFIPLGITQKKAYNRDLAFSQRLGGESFALGIRRRVVSQIHNRTERKFAFL